MRRATGRRDTRLAALRRAATALLVALLVGGCGGRDDNGARVPGRGALTIYTSLPRHGDSSRAATAVLAAQRLALADHHGRAGSRAVHLVELDSSKPGGDGWDPGVVEQNAKQAASDPSTIAYLGELDTGGSAISIPVTNDKEILQVSPYDGLTSLTQLQPGGPHTGPERYYPAGKTTFARLVPTDLAQAVVLVDWARQEGAKRLVVVHDDEVYGRTLSAQVIFMADQRGLPISDVKEAKSAGQPQDYAGLARDIASDPKKRPDAVIYTGIADRTAEPLVAALARAIPGVKLYASSGVAVPGFTGPEPVRLVEPARPASQYPAAARRLLARLGGQLGMKAAEVPTEALYGYASMRLVLDAIDRAGSQGGDRPAVVAAALKGDRGRGPLGSLGLTPTGDVADQRLAVYQRGPGGLAFLGLRRPQLPPAATGNASK
ncbi:MAG: branched-chain amino acid transport system substrate-binding protein [Thermoleophilaceae bacterium]|nr:branched-chain amino acid transport system substrate-binding protein [Thermoleophilaceae bacterium]